MIKTIYFHTINFKKLPIVQDNICYINNALNTIKEDELIQFQDTNAVIEINKVNNDYCFGSIGKLEDFQGKAMTRSRPKENINNKEDITEMVNYIEKFTYFCVDLSTYNCAVLRNSGIPSFRKFFRILLTEELKLLDIYEHIEVIDKLSDNINADIEKMSPITSFTFVHDGSKLPSNDHLTLDEIGSIDNDLIRKTKVCVTIDNTKDTSGIRKMFSRFLNYKEKYSEFTIENEEETIDVIRDRLTKKVLVPISDNTLKDQNLIFDILKKTLLNYN